MIKRLIFLCFTLLASIMAFSQMKVVSFNKEYVMYSNVPKDDQGFLFAIININTDLDTEKARFLSFSSNENTQIMVNYIKDGVVQIYLTAGNSKHLFVSHPAYGTTDFTFPYKLKPGGTYKMDLLCNQNKADSNIRYSSSLENSYTVSVYDKNGNQFTTGLFIKTSGRSYIRIQKGRSHYDQYDLIESDKLEYKFMTTGNTEIEPLYVK